jgi:hypothetical protein
LRGPDVTGLVLPVFLVEMGVDETSDGFAITGRQSILDEDEALALQFLATSDQKFGIELEGSVASHFRLPHEKSVD